MKTKKKEFEGDRKLKEAKMNLKKNTKISMKWKDEGEVGPLWRAYKMR